MPALLQFTNSTLTTSLLADKNNLLWVLLGLLFSSYGMVGQNFPSYHHIDSIPLGEAGISTLNNLVISTTTDSQGFIYFLTFGNGVHRYDPQTESFEEEFIDNELLDSPFDIAINSQDQIFVADYLAQGECFDNGKIKAFNSQGNYLPNETVLTSFFRPMGIVFDNEDNLYVAEYNQKSDTGCEQDEMSRVVIYKKDGSKIINDQDLIRPFRIAVDSQKNVYVSQAGPAPRYFFQPKNGSIKILDSNLDFIKEWKIETPGSIIVDEEDFIYVVDYGGKINFQALIQKDVTAILLMLPGLWSGIEDNEFKIRIFRRNGTEISLSESNDRDIDFPLDIAFDPCTGNLYLNDAYVAPGEYNLKFNLEIFKRTPELIETIPPVALCIDTFPINLAPGESRTITGEELDNGSYDACGEVTFALSKSTFTTSDEGPNTVILTVTDENNNSSTCPVVVQVEVDDPQATFVCKDVFTLQLDASGNATLEAEDLYTGDGTGTNFTLSKNSFTCSDIGVQIITLSYTGAETGDCPVEVTVEDKIAPIVSCIGTFPITLAPGESRTITGEDLDNGSYDVCGDVTFALSKSTFTTSDEGPNTVILTVTDENNNSSTCPVVVQVEVDDPQATFVCKDVFTLQLDASGNATLEAEDLYTGDGTGTNFTLSKNSFTCSDIGVQIITLSYTGAETGDCPVEVTVEDKIDPIVSCIGTFPITLAPGESRTITGGELDNGSYDVCGDVTFALSKSTFTTSDEGPNTVILTVTDENNNSSTCPVVVQVEVDDPQATFVCKDVFTLQLDASGNATLEAEDLYTGDGTGTNFTLSKNSFTCSDIGVQIITLSYTGAETGDCPVEVTVEDKIDPIVSCIGTFPITLAPGESRTITGGELDNGSYDVCGDVTFALSKSTFTTSDEGPNTVILTVTDENNNSSTCPVVVQVEVDDPQATFVCKDVFTLQLDASGNATLEAEDLYTGDGTGTNFTLSKNSFTCSDIGVQIITLSYTGAETGDCPVEVTVEDKIAPIVSCIGTFPITLAPGESRTITGGELDNGSYDVCGVVTFALSKSTFTTSDEGPNTVILTVTDENNNSSTCPVVVQVEVDDPQATFVCKDVFTLQLDASGNATLEAEDLYTGDGTGTNFTLSKNSFTCSDIGVQIITLSYTGAETGDCPVEVTVEDKIAPIVSCIGTFPITLAPGESRSITGGELDNGSYDACGEITSALSKSTFTTSDEGPNTVILTVTDENNNSSTCPVVVQVEVDDPQATFVCKDVFTLQLDASGNATLEAEDLYTGDGTGTEFTLSNSAFTCDDIGVQTVTLSYTGAETGSCPVEVTIEDNIDPVVMCMGTFPITLAPGESLTITGGELDNGSYDACGEVTFALSKSTFTASDEGPNTVMLTVTDENNNSSTCPVVVQVEVDDPEATFECKEAFILQLDATGNATLQAEDLYTGNPGNRTFSLSKENFNCTNTGSNIVTLNYSGSDGSGSCEINVEVVDRINPVLITRDISISLNEQGQATINPQMINNGSYDNCGELTFSLNKNTFSCKDLGVNEITLRGEDSSGNISTMNATVMITGDCNGNPGTPVEYIYIYPNPTPGPFTFAVPDGWIIEKAEVYDFRGRYFTTKVFEGRTSYSMDLSGLQSAVYVLILYTNEGEKILRVIIH